MSDVLIQVNGVSKKFTKRLRHAMWYGLRDLTQDFFYGDSNSKHDVLRPGEFWALRNISFEVSRGECLSVIGANGAGKTTLLKLINGVLKPNEGRIFLKGRVGALIELGAGFHPLLTGRENIYVNGSILGMSRAEIRAKFDSIVELAGIGDFLDAPVRSYSSGMNVRLGFSIAVHTDPDVLLIDEVLAVGDAAFQRRCQQKISQLREKGAALVLVSHNMAVVQHFSSRVLLLQAGEAVIGSFNDTYQRYLEKTLELPPEDKERVLRATETGFGVARQTGEIEISSIRLVDSETEQAFSSFPSGKTLVVDVTYESTVEVKRPVFQVGFYREDGVLCCVERTSDLSITTPDLHKGTGRFRVKFEPLELRQGIYAVEIIINDPMGVIPMGRKRSARMRVVDGGSTTMETYHSPVYRQPSSWEWLD